MVFRPLRIRRRGLHLLHRKQMISNGVVCGEGCLLRRSEKRTGAIYAKMGRDQAGMPVMVARLRCRSDGYMLRQFFAYYRPHRKLFLLDFSCAVLAGLLELSFPMAVRAFVDHLLPGD